MAETIFLIHGMCGGAWVWDRYCTLFESQGYHCVATTLRYHDIDPRDEAPPQLGTTGLLDYARDLAAEIEMSFARLCLHISHSRSRPGGPL